jgi:hypothetical protein
MKAENTEGVSLTFFNFINSILSLTLKNKIFIMKKIFQFIILFAAVSLVGCVAEQDFTFNEKTVVEFQSTVVSSPAVGKTFPLLALANKDSSYNAQVNLVGAPRSGETSVTISIDKTESTAVEGTHFKLPNGGKVVFPANTNVANFPFQTLKATGTAGTKVNVVFVLETTGDVLPSENYKKVGYAITL